MWIFGNWIDETHDLMVDIGFEPAHSVIGELALLSG
jgi:hypothetical protein